MGVKQLATKVAKIIGFDVERQTESSLVAKKPKHPSLWGPSGVLGFTSRLTVWGLGVAFASTFLSPIFGPSGGLLSFLSAAGLVVGGVGAAGWSGIVVRRRGVRLTWKVAAALGVPAGLSSIVVGVWLAFVRGVAVFHPPWFVEASLEVLLTLGFLLLLFLGADVVRFAITSGPKKSDSTLGDS